MINTKPKMPIRLKPSLIVIMSEYDWQTVATKRQKTNVAINKKNVAIKSRITTSVVGFVSLLFHYI